MDDPNIYRWRDSDFSMERIMELSRYGSMPDRWMDAYGLYLRRVSADFGRLVEEASKHPDWEKWRF